MKLYRLPPFRQYFQILDCDWKATIPECMLLFCSGGRIVRSGEAGPHGPE